MSRAEMHRELSILLVDDQEADVLLVEHALAELGVPHRMHVARDGLEALEYLTAREGATGDALPDLILLDLNMPRMGGLDVLREVKGYPVWRSIPTVVLTTSVAPADVQAAYERHANAFMRKPTSLTDLMVSLERMYGFWWDAAVLPSSAPPA